MTKSSPETLGRNELDDFADKDAQSVTDTKPKPKLDIEDEEKSSREPEDAQSTNEEQGKIKWVLAKSEIHLAFGPQRWYFLRCGCNWRLVRTKDSVWEELDILSPAWVAFKHDDGLVIGGADLKDHRRIRIVHTWNQLFNIYARDVDAYVTSRDGYIRLFNWLCDSTSQEQVDSGNLSVTIGSKGSYFARVQDNWISHALPQDLQRVLDRSKVVGETLPAHVALGINGAWVVLWTDGTRSWDLRYSYPSLQKTRLLDDTKNAGIVFVALNAYQDDRYFLTNQDGSCTYSITMSDSNESRIVNDMTDDYLKLRATRDGSSFEHTYTHNGKSVRTHISAEGLNVESKGDQLLRKWRRTRVELIDARNLGLLGAIAGGSGLLARIGGIGVMRSATIGASAGIGATLTLLFRS